MPPEPKPTKERFEARLIPLRPDGTPWIPEDPTPAFDLASMGPCIHLRGPHHYKCGHSLMYVHKTDRPPRLNGKRRHGMELGHRIAWYLKYGEWPAFVRHLCNDAGCVNVAHLRAHDEWDAGHGQNMLDMVGSGRHYNQAKAACPDCGGEYSTRTDGRRYCPRCDAAWRAKRAADPAYRARVRARRQAHYRAQCAALTPAQREARKAEARDAHRRAMADPAKRAARRAQTMRNETKRMADPDYRAKRNAQQADAKAVRMADPAYRARVYAQQKATRVRRMADPDYRARLYARQRRARQRRQRGASGGGARPE